MTTLRDQVFLSALVVQAIAAPLIASASPVEFDLMLFNDGVEMSFNDGEPMEF